jgi:type IV secretion system protein TrbL
MFQFLNVAISKFRLLAVFFAFAVFLFSANAIAQAGPDDIAVQDAIAAVVPTVPQNMSTIDFAVSMIDGVGRKVEAMRTNGKVMSLGMSLLAMLFVGQVAWLLLKGVATGTGVAQIFSDILPLGIATIMAYLFMGQGGGTGELGKILIGTIDNIGAAVTTDYVAGQGLGETMRSGLMNVFSFVERVIAFDNAKPTGSEFGLANLGVLLIGGLMKVFTIVAVIIFSLIAVGLFIGMMVISQIQFSIALMLLPIFVPMMIWKPLSGLFNSWLTFTLVSGMSKIFGLIMFQIGNTILSGLVDQANALNAGGTGDSVVNAYGINMVAYSTFILMTGLIGLLMAKVPSIAGGLIGSIGVGFDGWGSMTRGPVGKAVTGGMGKEDRGSGAGKGENGSRNTMSGITGLMPNAIKPVTSALGAGLSVAGGSHKAMSDMTEARKNNSTEISRDTSKMSVATRNAYVATVERANARRGASGQANYTIHPVKSSTAPSKSPPPPPPQGKP